MVVVRSPPSVIFHPSCQYLLLLDTSGRLSPLPKLSQVPKAAGGVQLLVFISPKYCTKHSTEIENIFLQLSDTWPSRSGDGTALYPKSQNPYIRSSFNCHLTLQNTGIRPSPQWQAEKQKGSDLCPIPLFPRVTSSLFNFCMQVAHNLKLSDQPQPKQKHSQGIVPLLKWFTKGFSHQRIQHSLFWVYTQRKCNHFIFMQSLSHLNPHVHHSFIHLNQDMETQI